MAMWLGWVFVLALAATAAVAIWRCDYPWMPLALVLTAVQAASVQMAIDPTSAVWLRRVWLPGEALALAASLLFVVAVLVAETAAIEPVPRFWLRFGAFATSLSLVGLIWVGTHHNDPYWIFVGLRSRAWQWSAFALGITLFLVPQRPSRESIFLLIIAGAHAVIGPLVAIPGIGPQAAFRVITIAACLAWIMFPESRGLRCEVAQAALPPRGSPAHLD